MSKQQLNQHELMMANAAVARGAYEAGVSVVSSYPGTPSTEITEYAATYGSVHTEWAPNEKVALEVAYGASLAGGRAMSCMKHVGVNVAADPLFTASYTGVNAGLVIAVADDPGMHSSQNEQDSRCYAKAAHIPMLEPSDSAEAKDYTALAFELSERYDTPVFVRLTTRIAHSQSIVKLNPPLSRGLRAYVKDAAKYVSVPANARKMHVKVEVRMKRLSADCESFELNRQELRSDKLGVVCAGAIYQYVREALPDASVFKLGMVHPLPLNSIEKFAAKVERLLVIEELEPVIEDALKARGIACEGKEIFGLQGEYSVSRIRASLLGKQAPQPAHELPARPPVLCAGCPHRGIFYVLARQKLTVLGDIGCYSLGAGAPLSSMDTILCMGASVGMAHGWEKAQGREGSRGTVAVIGDSTFMHSGITGLINAVYNKSNITLLILDNSTTGMTGHQQNPATGKSIKGENAPAIDLETLCRACGAFSVRIADAYSTKECDSAIKAALTEDGVSVIIVRRACRLLEKGVSNPFEINDLCKKCGACLKLGCPAIRYVDGVMSIDGALCNACGLCAGVCKFHAIEGERFCD